MSLGTVRRKVRIKLNTSIHVWGGLGSQLNALILLNRLKLHNSNRDFSLIVHDDPTYPFAFKSQFGIDICELNLDLPVRLKNDFQVRLTQDPNSFTRRFSNLNTKLSARSALNFLQNTIKYRAEFNERSSFRLNPLTRHLVGHYSFIKYSREDFVLLIDQIFEHSDPSSFEFDTVIHLRLGDLLTLKKGSSAIETAHQISRMIDEENLLGLNTAVFSETSDVARTYLPIRTNLNVTFYDTATTSAVSLLRHGIMSQTFVGSRSKISFWVSALRILKNKHQATFVLEEHRPALDRFIGHLTPNTPQYYANNQRLV